MGILDNLNSMQKEAVISIQGPLLVLAGAGSGKTRVLTRRIAYMIKENDIKPYNIIAFTFTNKAAKEMKARVFSLVGKELASSIWIGTFHSMCVRILKIECERLGFSRNFVIYDTDDQKKILNKCLEKLDINPKQNPPAYFLSEISSAKDQMISPERFIKMYDGDFKMEVVGKVYKAYQDRLRTNDALDFDDIIYQTIELFKNNPDVLLKYQDKFKYVLVDEYQDTNTAQYTLIQLLSRVSSNLCVVGDDDQSIYGWRGANIQNILNFENDFPGTKTIKLEENYRSTQNILDGANEVVKNNVGRKAKKLWTGNGKGEKITLYTGIDERDEARFVVGTIKKFVEEQKFENKDFAILYRTNAQSRVFEEEMLNASIPYKIYGGINFYGRKEIKDVVAYLKFISNPSDSLSFARIVNEPKRGIGDATAAKLIEFAQNSRTSLYDAIDYGVQAGISNGIVNKMVAFKSIITDIKHGMTDKSPREVIEAVISQTGYLEMLEKEDTSEAQNRIENVKELISVAVEFENNNEEKMTGMEGLQAFLDNISLVADIDSMDEDNVVTMMTIHSAKGLEFPCVFLAGMEEGIFPSGRSFDSPDRIEEERRLCYVGITRAKNLLFLTNANQRFIYGRQNINLSSRFIEEIPEDLINNLNKAYIDSITETKSFQTSPESFKTSKISSGGNGKFYTGMKVQHDKFGIGVIVTMDDKSGDLILTIAFEKGGIKKLMAEYANLLAV